MHRQTQPCPYRTAFPSLAPCVKVKRDHDHSLSRCSYHGHCFSCSEFRSVVSGWCRASRRICPGEPGRASIHNASRAVETSRYSMLSSLLFGFSRPGACRCSAHMDPFRKTRNAKPQINSANRSEMAFAEQRVHFGAVLARRPGVNAIPGRAIGNAPHDSFPVTRVIVSCSAGFQPAGAKVAAILKAAGKMPALPGSGRICADYTSSFCGEPSPAGGRRKLDAQKYCLHSRHRARFACGVCRGTAF